MDLKRISVNSDIWIIDFGSQYTQLITRKIREIGHHSQIIEYEEFLERVKKGERPQALVLSGGPDSIYRDAQDYKNIFEDSNLPILGICYGMQIMAQTHGGKVAAGIQGEYGKALIKADQAHHIWPNNFQAWMSHGDHVEKIPSQWEQIMTSSHGLVAGMKHNSYPWVGLQFHPEVEHSERGREVLDVFFKTIAGLEKNWTGKDMLRESLELIRQADPGFILCAFSGGVDSLVAASLVHQLYPEKLYCFFVDHGLLRPQDHSHIEKLKQNTNLKIEIIDAKEIFLRKLKGVSDPEEKRKIIGHTFIEVFESKVHQFEQNHGIHFTHLLQGTLYPDVIESHSALKSGGRSKTIKSHHNVGGLPERMKLKLLEPLRSLFKDEVRALGPLLKLDSSDVERHPFPGPGIGVRILGELTAERILQIQMSDQILFEELLNHHLYQSCWQAFTVLLPVKTVGVKGDARAYEEVICLRIVNSSDGMTADYSELPHSFLSLVSRRITNEVKGITRVVYDITSKPPGTIEWE